ncbi:MAG: hypothetical protein IKB09_09745 [Oscillospiraceae bacterium]|nr:hypothetical protein [Oscillospiraceae bacterium]MBR6595161.1 hypothetical protein [Oscillospiraceae bacterium]
MLRTGRDDLICDLAETYGVLDYRALPASILAVLAAGLREDSRSKMNLSGHKATRAEMLLAAAVDGLNRITWLLSGVCPHEGEGPKSILRAILQEGDTEETNEATVFDSPKAYEDEWERITGVRHGGW